MVKAMYKDRPGGYITMPVVITKNKNLTIEEKFVLCFIMGYWMNKGSVSFLLSYISDSLYIDEDSVKGALNKLISFGLIKVTDKRGTYSGDVSFCTEINADIVNSFFGCELIGMNEPGGKTQPVAQPIRKQIMKVRDPLAWMESEYYKNR